MLFLVLTSFSFCDFKLIHIWVTDKRPELWGPFVEGANSSYLSYKLFCLSPPQTSWWPQGPAVQHKRVPLQRGHVLPGRAHHQSGLCGYLWQQGYTGRVLQRTSSAREMLGCSSDCSHLPQVSTDPVLLSSVVNSWDSEDVRDTNAFFSTQVRILRDL